VNFTLTVYKSRPLREAIAFTQSKLVNVDGSVNLIDAHRPRPAAAAAENGGQPS
jgi:hypothetical protein